MWRCSENAVVETGKEATRERRDARKQRERERERERERCKKKGVARKGRSFVKVPGRERK